MTKTLKPEDFDLALFLSGATPTTEFVDIYPDRRLMGELKRVSKQLRQARKLEEGDTSSLSAVTDVPDSVALKKTYDALRAEAEATVLVVEVHEVIRQVREAIKEDFKQSKQVTDEDIAKDLSGLGNELDYWVLAHAFAYPKFETPTQVAQFAAAIGDAQWNLILDAWLKTLDSRTSLADVDPDFLLESSSASDGEES